jgi:hypothetical protein
VTGDRVDTVRVCRAELEKRRDSACVRALASVRRRRIHTWSVVVIGLIRRERCLKQAEGKSTDTERHLKVHAIAEAEILDSVGPSRRVTQPGGLTRLRRGS